MVSFLSKILLFVKTPRMNKTLRGVFLLYNNTNVTSHTGLHFS